MSGNIASIVFFVMPKRSATNIWLMFFAAVAILLRLFNQIQVAHYFGASAQRDAYFLANTFITFLLTIHYRSAVLFFLPKQVAYLNSQKKEGIGQAFVWIHLLSVGGVLLILSLFFYLLFWVGFIPFKNPDLLFQVLQILLLGLILQSSNNILTVLYHSRNHFILPAIQNAISVLVIIIVVYFFYQQGVIVLAWGYLLGNLICLLWLIVARPRLVFRELNWQQDLAASRIFLREITPFMLIALLGMLVHIIEPFFVADRASGIISYLGYSYQIVLILLTLVSASIITTFFPKIANLHTQGKSGLLTKTLQNTMQLTFIFCLSISGFVLLYGQEIIALVFERGNFLPEDSRAVYRVLRWELLVFVFGALNLLLNRFFYLNRNTRVLFRASLIALLVYLLAAYSLYQSLDYEGLGIALSLWAIVYFSILLFYLKQSLNFRLRAMLFFFLKISTGLGLFLFIFWQVSSFFTFAAPIVTIPLLGIIYCSLLLLLFFKMVAKN